MRRRRHGEIDTGHEQYLFPIARRRKLAREKRREKVKQDRDGERWNRATDD